MTGLVFIWRVNALERTVNAHSGPIFSMFSSGNCVVTGAKEKYVQLNHFLMKNLISRRSLGSTRILNPLKVWDFDMNDSRSIKLDLPPTDTICVRSVCRNSQVESFVRVLEKRKINFREKF
jgi:hypothetical protein